VATPSASPVGMRTECAAGSSNWSTFSDSTESIYVSSVRHSLILDKPSGLPNMSATAQTDQHLVAARLFWSGVA
jgi:hypothetical protein